MAIYHAVEQRSEEWHYMRLGRPGSSEFHRIVTPGGKISKQAEEYAYRLIAEQMLGQALDTIETDWMIRGQELEALAVTAYEFQTDTETSPGGVVTNDAGTYGCSPDRLIGAVGLLEMKVPAPNTHISYLLNPAGMEKEKTPQVQGQLLCSEREWVDLVSYHPELPTVIHRVTRDEAYISTLRTALDTFCEQLVLMRQKLESLYGPFPERKRRVQSDDPGPMNVSDADVTRIIQVGVSTPQS